MSRFATELARFVDCTAHFGYFRVTDQCLGLRVNGETGHAPREMLSKAKVASAQQQGDFFIKPETVQPVLSTSEWPLLLKNYDKLLVRSSHFTPIPSGCSPLKRDIASYIKLAFTMISTRVKLTVIHRQVGCY